MFGVIVMATSMSGAFAGQSVTFASAFVGANLCRGLVLSWVARGQAVQRRPQRVAVWAFLTAPLWLVGAVLHGTPQRILWTVAAFADYGLALTGWPVPGWAARPTPNGASAPSTSPSGSARCSSSAWATRSW
jgi:low temperature requirement protein LtrA